MATGYNFKGKGSTTAVRQFVNTNQVFDQRAPMTGVNATIGIAQDHVAPEDAQTDTRLQYNVYDAELAKETNNAKGVDNTVALSRGQWDSMLENGELVEQDGVEYLTYQADVIFTPKGAIPNTKTVEPMEIPFDKAKHDELTLGAREARKTAAKSADVSKDVEVEVEPELEP